MEDSKREQDNGSLHDCSWIQNRILWLVLTAGCRDGINDWLLLASIILLFAGKYLNNYALKNSGVGVEHIPPGWTTWYTLQGNRYPFKSPTESVIKKK
jgi:hypothetical protein